MSEEQAKYTAQPIFSRKIDANELEKWLCHLRANFDKRHEELYEGKEYETAARMHARKRVVEDIFEAIQSGKFDSSSEQAWREEAERLEKRMKEYELQAIKNINLAEGFEEQLNQAVEVLKGIAETVTVEMDYPSFMPSVTYKAIKIKCESFLSSLSQGMEEKV